MPSVLIVAILVLIIFGAIIFYPSKEERAARKERKDRGGKYSREARTRSKATPPSQRKAVKSNARPSKSRSGTSSNDDAANVSVAGGVYEFQDGARNSDYADSNGGGHPHHSTIHDSFSGGSSGGGYDYGSSHSSSSHDSGSSSSYDSGSYSSSDSGGGDSGGGGGD